jgi:twinkle protein
MSEWVQIKLPCPKCPSSDAYHINTRGWGHCFSCGANVNEFAEGDHPPEEAPVSTDKSMVPFGEYRALVKRKITEETCKKFGYFYGEFKGKTVQVAPYRDEDSKPIAQKIRFADKDFLTRGEFKKVGLFGDHLWGTTGKKIVITEGEIDCMTVSQLQGNKWPVVSVPNGAQGAVAAIKKRLEYLLGFEQIIIMFDMDDPGIAAAQAVAEALPFGQAYIATLPLKDPNEMLMAGRGEEVIRAIWNAKPYRPDGLVSIEDILEDIKKPIEIGLPWFLPTLTDLTYGRRPGDVLGFGAGTGVGKTDLFTQQAAFDVEVLKEKVGLIFLEQKPIETGKRLAGKVAKKRFHIPGGNWTQEELVASLLHLKNKVTFYDSWGETEWDAVKAKIIYMVKALGIKLIYLDHLTAMADPACEKESLEVIMKEMAGLANELGCIIHYISHLTTPEGKPHEEGGRVMIRHFKGSRSIGFWSFFMFGLERNGQSEDYEERTTTTLRILKDRYTGQATGQVILLGYDTETGLLYEKDGKESIADQVCPFDTDDSKPEF